MFSLQPPRHIPTLPGCVKTRRNGGLSGMVIKPESTLSAIMSARASCGLTPQIGRLVPGQTYTIRSPAEASNFSAAQRV
jgi:hypothetical protein